eukprot:gene3799-biopygen2657
MTWTGKIETHEGLFREERMQRRDLEEQLLDSIRGLMEDFIPGALASWPSYFCEEEDPPPIARFVVPSDSYAEDYQFRRKSPRWHGNPAGTGPKPRTGRRAEGVDGPRGHPETHTI